MVWSPPVNVIGEVPETSLRVYSVISPTLRAKLTVLLASVDVTGIRKTKIHVDVVFPAYCALPTPRQTPSMNLREATPLETPATVYCCDDGYFIEI